MVKAVALDNVLSGLNLEKINWIKIDVEGAELEVLKRLQDTLKRYRPALIVEIKEGQGEIEDFMGKLGYTMKNIAPEYYLLRPVKS